MPGGSINIMIWRGIKKKKIVKKFQISVQYWKLCFSKKVFKVTRIIILKSDTV